MKKGNNSRILLWAILLYAALFCTSITAAILFHYFSKLYLSAIFAFVSIFSIVVLISQIFLPIWRQRKLQPKLQLGVKGFRNSWETINSLLSGEWVNVIDDNNRLIQENYANEITLNRARFRTLQSQINPHFLYNSLDSIRGLALIENAEKTAEMAEALGAFFRYNISSNLSMVRLELELRNIENYFIILKHRFANRFTLKLGFDPEDKEILDYPIPKMIIQPLVENAVFHGLERKRGSGKVIITIEKTSTRIFIRVKDNGKGIEEDIVAELNSRLRNDSYEIGEHEQGSGNNIGMLNISQRIHSVFGRHFGLSLSSTFGVGTEVELSLPFPPQENLLMQEEINAV